MTTDAFCDKIETLKEAFDRLTAIGADDESILREIDNHLDYVSILIDQAISNRCRFSIVPN